jgi:hypothetical protein
MIPKRSRPLVCALLVLAWTTTASAECSWVVWQSTVLPSTGEKLWGPVGAFSRESGGETACGRSVEKLRQRAEQSERSRRLSTSFVCLPDTVDPRGSKGKYQSCRPYHPTRK